MGGGGGGGEGAGVSASAQKTIMFRHSSSSSSSSSREARVAAGPWQRPAFSTQQTGHNRKGVRTQNAATATKKGYVA
jgi:hypothetical protein